MSEMKRSQRPKGSKKEHRSSIINFMKDVNSAVRRISLELESGLSEEQVAVSSAAPAEKSEEVKNEPINSNEDQQPYDYPTVEGRLNDLDSEDEDEDRSEQQSKLRQRRSWTIFDLEEHVKESLKRRNSKGLYGANNSRHSFLDDDSLLGYDSDGFIGMRDDSGEERRGFSKLSSEL